jgi:hypothetical protein
MVNCENADLSEPAKQRSLLRFLDLVDAPVIVTSIERLALPQGEIVNWEISALEPAEQRQLWRDYLGESATNLNGQLDKLVSNFQLNHRQIASVSKTVFSRIQSKEHSPKEIGTILWDVCRTTARSRLDELAQRISSSAGWEDLILPKKPKNVLREMIARVRQRTQVYERWGFGSKSGRGLGITSLFAGTSGTGKTMAAEIIAGELELDLYRIDLSTVVSKYIGETEKNLAKLFAAAETGGVILLFDEGDSLFGKRSEVKDSRVSEALSLDIAMPT